MKTTQRKPTKAEIAALAAWVKLNYKLDRQPKFAREKHEADTSSYVPALPTATRVVEHHPSKGGMQGSTAAKTSPQYTGTAMLGVATMHKSSSVPVFSADDAAEISRMRR